MASAQIGPRLILPKRFEILQEVADTQGLDLTRIVRKVPQAASRIEVLLQQVRDGGLGRFEFLLGKAGSGKTTFLRTLPTFFTTAPIVAISEKVPLLQIPEHIRSQRLSGDPSQVFVVFDRDNPKVLEQESRDFFEELRKLFRTLQGKVVLLWPVTDESAAKLMAKTAWDIGRDSIVDPQTKGINGFEGLPKSEYYDVADTTTRSLNGGQGLESFGLTPEVANPLVRESDTISLFYSRLEDKSREVNGLYTEILKEKKIPSVWILLAGDDNQELNLTVATLTQGTEKRVDIDRLVSYLDTPEFDAAYLKEWKTRRHQIAYVMRLLDVRLFELSPNVALSAVRAFGVQTLKGKLKRQSVAFAEMAGALQSAKFFQALALKPMSNVSRLRKTEEETSHEFNRIQRTAGENDKPLNKALAAAVESILNDLKIPFKITAEQESLGEGSNLRPDILVDLADGRRICLEPTWRTTGAKLPDEEKGQQNTLTVGHIQKYLLAKVLEYAKDLGL